MGSWNRFNGLRWIPVILSKPLKRLLLFRVAAYPKLKLGENERVEFCKRLSSLFSTQKVSSLNPHSEILLLVDFANLARRTIEVGIL